MPTNIVSVSYLLDQAGTYFRAESVFEFTWRRRHLLSCLTFHNLGGIYSCADHFAKAVHFIMGDKGPSRDQIVDSLATRLAQAKTDMTYKQLRKSPGRRKGGAKRKDGKNFQIDDNH